MSMFCYKIGGGWGYHLTWAGEPRDLSATDRVWDRWRFRKKERTWIERDFYGHGKFPMIGDIIVHLSDDPTKPGNQWQIVEVKRQDNPDDMVIGTAEFIGQIYSDDPLIKRGERGGDLL